jgi:acetyl-CoA acetyltransferase
MESTPEGLAALKPILEDGTVTAGGQTHPGDGNAAMVITTPERAGELSTNPNIAIRILGFGLARVELGYMPEAPIPAAKTALESGNRKIEQVDAIKTHNPFAVNDLVFASETKTDAMEMNNYGCSLVWGHPSSATGLRSVIELIEELVMRGGGLGLFTGCAGGDSAMAVLIEVADR